MVIQQLYQPPAITRVNMPISKYYSGSGEKVMSAMKEQYGEKKGKQVFYATANKQKQNPAVEGLKKAK